MQQKIIKIVKNDDEKQWHRADMPPWVLARNDVIVLFIIVRPCSFSAPNNSCIWVCRIRIMSFITIEISNRSPFVVESAYIVIVS